MQQNYLPPDHDDFLTPEQIKLRYQDTSLIIFKEQRNRNNNYLSFGTSRRTIEYSNFGNDPVIIKPKIINTDKDGNLRNRTKQSNICSIN
ncbi:GSCOCG00006729001-RA-CDS [Cotesia congregata]|nr:GSCOCG00006729001-RA-CDS [Cotesia congregata]